MSSSSNSPTINHTIVSKIIAGVRNDSIQSFICSYDSVVYWMIGRDKPSVIRVNIYSIDFLLIWDDAVNVLEPHLSDNLFIVHTNMSVMPRYSFSLVSWMREIHDCVKLLSDYLSDDVRQIIAWYLMI